MARDEADDFTLHDLRVEVVAPEGARIHCGARPGDSFELRGEMLHLPPGQGFSIYSLAALLPLLPAKQRPSHPNDWMTSDAEVACPDPNCPTRFRITRLTERRFRHSETTAVPLPARETTPPVASPSSSASVSSRVSISSTSHDPIAAAGSTDPSPSNG